MLPTFSTEKKKLFFHVTIYHWWLSPSEMDKTTYQLLWSSACTICLQEQGHARWGSQCEAYPHQHVQRRSCSQLLILAPAHSQPLKRAYKNVHIYGKGMTLTLRYIHSHGRNFFLYYCWKETTWAIAHNRLQYINVEISIWAPTLHGWTSCLAIPPGFSYQRHFTPFKYNLYQTSLNIISRVIR